MNKCKKSGLVVLWLKRQFFYSRALIDFDWNQESKKVWIPLKTFPLNNSKSCGRPDWHCLNGHGGNHVQKRCSGYWSKYCVPQRSKEWKVTIFWLQSLSLLEWLKGRECHAIRTEISLKTLNRLGGSHLHLCKFGFGPWSLTVHGWNWAWCLMRGRWVWQQWQASCYQEMGHVFLSSDLHAKC